MLTRHLYLVGLAGAFACAPASSTSSGSGAPTPRPTSIITADEIEDAHADALTAYDAIARLRPNWLAAHGVATQGSAYAAVFVDGQRYGDLTSLRNIPAHQVAGIRYYDITQAGAIYGIKGDTGGVIEVKTKSR
jgi:hypothetical protein